MIRTHSTAAIGILVLLSLALAATGEEQASGPSSIQTGVELEAAQVAEDFFSRLSDGDYQGASELYVGSYEGLADWNPSADANDHVGLLRFGCERNGLQCLKMGEVLGRPELLEGAVRLQVTFLTSAGETFVRGPCCGEEAPADSVFAVELVEAGGRLKVRSLPPHMP